MLSEDIMFLWTMIMVIRCAVDPANKLTNMAKHSWIYVLDEIMNSQDAIKNNMKKFKRNRGRRGSVRVNLRRRDITASVSRNVSATTTWNIA